MGRPITAFSAGGCDQLAVEQGGYDSAGVHASDFADFGHRDRLLVGDDGECLERW